MIYKNLRDIFSTVFPVALFAALLAIYPLQALASGSHLDPTFAGDGKLATDINGGSDDRAYDVAIQQDGKILVVGGSNVSFADELTRNKSI